MFLFRLMEQELHNMFNLSVYSDIFVWENCMDATIEVLCMKGKESIVGWIDVQLIKTCPFPT